MNYKAPLFLFNRHLETIYPSLIRKVNLRPYTRERINTPDQDFLDLDWITQGSTKLIIISHGLEGSADRPYVKGLAKAAVEEGFDVLAWNFRGCSGEINRQLRFYHSGATDDLDTVVKHALTKKYNDVSLAGFSLGGNLSLKYLGERDLVSQIKNAVAFSVPLNLFTSCAKISQPSNWIYANRFLKSLKKKIIQKHHLYPNDIDLVPLARIKSIQTFDDYYTAPLHGYENAAHYYDMCSSIRFVTNIKIPTLIINAKNDPFLSEECYPAALLKDHPYVKFETPERGGHVGFSQFIKSGRYWSEERATQFLKRV